MPEVNQGDGGDRLNDLDLLRDVLGGNTNQGDDAQTQAKIVELESQMNQMRQEMRVQGDEVQQALHQKINEVLEALQINQFEGSQPSPLPTPRSPQPAHISPPVSSPHPEPRRSPQHLPVPTSAVPIPASPAAQNQDINISTSPLPEPIDNLSSPPTETNPSLDSLGGLEGFTEQINAILTQDSPPQGSPNPTPVTTPEPPVEVTVDDGRSPHPDPIKPSTTDSPVSTSSLPPTSPPATLKPEPDSPQLTVVAEDQATRINHLKQVLRDEDVVQLRQINEKLDFKLRQVEDYIASSQQPINDLLPLMTELVQLKIKETKTLQPPPPSNSPNNSSRQRTPWWAVFSLLLLLILVPLGLYGYWLRREYLLEQDMAIALAATPELALYRLGADVQGNKLYLTGKVPNETLRNRATAIAASTLPSLDLSNNIVIVDPLLDPSLLNDEINKILDPLNAVNGIQVTHQLDGDRLNLDGTVLQKDDINTIITALEKISGINQITNNIQVQSQPITARLYFDQNSAAIKPDDVDQKLNRVKEFLQQYPNLNLRIIGYQHPSESANDVALKRAQSTQILLEDQGIDRRRIIALGINQSPPNTTAADPIWLSRTIIFEISAATTDSSADDLVEETP